MAFESLSLILAFVRAITKLLNLKNKIILGREKNCLVVKNYELPGTFLTFFSLHNIVTSSDL